MAIKLSRCTECGKNYPDKEMYSIEVKKGFFDEFISGEKPRHRLVCKDCK